MAQRYTQPVPRALMANGLCPECGTSPGSHSDDMRFWVPRACDLTRNGVLERIATYQQDTQGGDPA